jgi:hypothetical protein
VTSRAPAKFISGKAAAARIKRIDACTGLLLAFVSNLLGLLGNATHQPSTHLSA